MDSSQEQILNGWKRIAEYLDRDTRTVQRWEMHRGLPIRRIPGEARSSVYAVKADIDRWLTTDTPMTELIGEVPPPHARPPGEPLPTVALAEDVAM